MSDQHAAVREYYAAFGEHEWARLENESDGLLEHAVHTHVIAAHLPPCARVLDIGGGPGRYTVWLAERGHRVVLADLSSELLAIARRKVGEAGVDTQVEEIVEADACDLGRWPDGSFDAVLCLGPFYHLPDPGERERAAGELARVLRPGGLAFIALMPRYGLFRRTLAIPDERRHLGDPEFVRRLLEDGVFQNDVPGRFTGGYGARPEEVAPFFERHGLQTVMLLASTGFAPDLQEPLAVLRVADPPAFRSALDLLLATAADPCILGMATHLLYVGKKG